MHWHLQVEKIDFDGSAVVFPDFRRKAQKKLYLKNAFRQEGVFARRFSRRAAPQNRQEGGKVVWPAFRPQLRGAPGRAF